jgi:hypothetical protein
MRGRARGLLAVGLAWGVVGLVGTAATAAAEGSPSGVGSSAGAGAGGASSSLSGPLVISESPTQGEQAQADKEAKLSSPEAVAAREASRTEYEGLSAGQAARTASEDFPGVVDEPAGGPPKLPAGQSILGYPTDEAAQVDLREGKHAIIESLAPIALETSGGGHVPVDLGLSETGGAFEPKTPVVGVRIPKSLGGGVQLPGVGVSMTPVNAQGAALGGSEGVLDGSSVLYANTQTDMDSLVKPTTAGFEADTLLRSVESPQQLFFRVGLPAEASLAATKDGSGGVEVVKEGETIATVLPPGAQDAAGMAVPVSMSVSGDTLVLSVADHAAEYQYPIEVDPEVTDPRLAEGEVEVEGKKVKRRSNWAFHTTSETLFAHKGVYEGAEKEHLETYAAGTYATNEFAYWGYQTQGVSKIFEVTAETEAKNTGAKIESFLELLSKTGGQESKEQLSNEAEKTTEYTRRPAAPICPLNSKKEQECLAGAGEEGNIVHFQQTAVGAGSKFSDVLYKALVSLSEPAGTHSWSSVHYSGGWLSHFSGHTVELIGGDKGIGVATTRLEYENSPGKWQTVQEHKYMEKENGCQGVQCFPERTELTTLPEGLVDGEDKIRYRAEEAMSGTESIENELGSTSTVKVDTSPPHRATLNGLPPGNELSERPYEMTAVATDGEGSTIPSSGVKSIEVYVDGKSIEDKEAKEVKEKRITEREVGKREGNARSPKANAPEVRSTRSKGPNSALATTRS